MILYQIVTILSSEITTKSIDIIYLFIYLLNIELITKICLTIKGKEYVNIFSISRNQRLSKF